MKIVLLNFFLVFVLNGCSMVSAPSNSHKATLYAELGGMGGIETIVDLFINEIGFDQAHFKHFANTDIDRFRSKLTEHICQLSDGPCEYTGDDMITVHTGMNISEHEFNHTVDLLITAMNKADIKHTTQNKLLARLVPLRSDIIYR